VLKTGQGTGEYYGWSLELPGALGGGETAERAAAEIREAATSVIAYMLEEGEVPPTPATDEKRTEQVNVRLTAEEKLRLEAAAKRDGFRGLSDFVRAAALTATTGRG